tara:strand:- start:237 stop:386 length:150 start_codon:yes stop_codon:yes gene_type:complete
MGKTFEDLEFVLLRLGDAEDELELAKKRIVELEEFLGRIGAELLQIDIR